MMKKFYQLLLVLCVLMMVVGCGGGEGDTASGGSNTPPATISGPGGSTLTAPAGALNGGVGITLTETANITNLVSAGEKIISKALSITVSSDEAIFGDGTFSVSIPVDRTKITDVSKLTLKVRLTTGVSYPLYGIYDSQTGAFKVELSGVLNGWVIAVVEDPSIKIVRLSGSGNKSAGASLLVGGWLTNQDWKTFEWVVVNHTNMSEADIKTKILPELWSASETLSKAGFRSPKIYIDPRLSPAARVCQLIGGAGAQGSHFHAGTITLADGSWIYTEDQSGFDSDLLDAEQLSALGQLYINHGQFVDLNAQYGVSLGNIVVHELFHAVQHGYDIRKHQKSLSAYLEGTATPLGQTYQATGGSVTGPSISVRVLRPNEHTRLYQAVDDPAAPLNYTKQDFFAYVSKRYASNSFAWTDQLFEYMNTWTSNKFGLTALQYRELYRKATDEAFSALFRAGLSKIFREYALDRAYEHGPHSVLRPAEETVQNGFGQNHLAKTLFQWNNNDANGLKKFEPKTNASIQFPKIEPLSCYAFTMVLPAQADAASPVGFPLVFKLEGGDILPSSESGMKIVAFLEDANGNMAANGRIDITDVSKPAMIPYRQGAVNLTVLIMNGYLEDKNVKVTVSAGPYIESVSPNPAKAGDAVTLQGISFGAARGTSKLFLGTKEISQITSWNNTRIVFSLPNDAASGKVKVVVNGTTSNEVLLNVNVEEPESKTFNFLQSWSKTHFPSGWDPAAATINFSANVNGRVLNALNPQIALKNFNVDNAKIVEVSNMRGNEVVTIEGTINVTLSASTISPSSPTSRYVYTYSNPKLLRYVNGVLVETYPDMNFKWVVDNLGVGYYKTDLYVEYDLEIKRYTRAYETDPFTLAGTENYKTKEFHLQIEADKLVPNWDTP